MSTFVPVEVTCPSCGHGQTESLATSLNVTRTPGWRDEVLADTFQQIACGACSHRWEAVEPFVYIDFTHRIYIGVFAADAAATWWQHEQAPADAFTRNLGWAAPPVARPIGEGFTVRTVFGLAALREKVVVLEAGLDDIVVEALKLRLLLSRPQPQERLSDRLRVHRAGSDVLHLDDSDDGTFAVPRAAYDDLAADLDLLAQLIPSLTAGPYVDVGRIVIAGR